MKLPYRDNIDREQIRDKLINYALNFNHKDGKHKARLFQSKLGINLSNLDKLLSAIIEAVNTCSVSYTNTTQYGNKYVIDFIMETDQGKSKVRSAWIIRFEDNYPRLTSIYPIN
jgi:hypothetical protein